MPAPGSTFPYLGHEPELDVLQRRLESAVMGRGGMIVLRGESGVGTTRTAHQVAARADRLGMVVLWGSFVEGLLGRPFGALAEAFDELVTGLTPTELRDQVGAGAPALARVCPGLRDVLLDIPPAAPLDALDEQLRLHDAVLAWLRRAALGQPLLFVLDDLQLADADTLALIGHVAPAAAGLRLLIVGTWAVETGAGTAEPPNAEVVDIGGLDDGATAALLSELAERPLPSATVSAIQAASGGHPLFARQLYWHLAEEGALRPDPAAPRAAAVAQLPATLEDVIAWRVSRLPLEGRTALSALACFPLGAPPHLLADASGLSRSRLVEALERIVAGGLVRTQQRGGHYAVVHDRIRRALLAATPAAARQRIHAQAAELLEDELGADARSHAAELAWHLTLATRSPENDRRALRYLLVAAEQAGAAYAHCRVVECLERAVDIVGDRPTPERADLLGRLALAQAEVGLRDAAAATLSLLLVGGRRAAPPGRDVWQAIVGALRQLRPDGAPDEEHLRLVRLALDRVPADPLLRARLELLSEGWHARDWAADAGAVRALVWQVGETDAAATLIEKSTDESDLADAFASPRPRDGRQAARLASLARGWRRPPTVLRGLRASTLDLVMRLGMFREGAQQAARYLAAAERYGSMRDVATALLLLARCRAVLGEFAVTREILAAADDVLGRVPQPASLATERLLAELVLAHFGDGDWSDLALQAAEAAAVPQPEGLLLAAETALAHVRRGSEVEARALISPLLDAAADLPPLTYARDAALLSTLTAAWEAGAAEHVPAGRLLVDRARAAGAGASHAATPRLCLARLDGLLGAVPDARAGMAGERERLDATGMRPLRAIVDHDEAVVLAAAGPAGYVAASALLQQAAEHFHALGMAGWVERVRALQSTGFEAAAQPGGRLHFSYPAGLSRREADLVRLVAAGATPDEAARALDLDDPSAERHLASALEKLGAASPAEVPRLARRHGLGGA